MASGHGGSMVKEKKFWPLVSTSRHTRHNFYKRKVTVYRRITWHNPTPEFVEEMKQRFKYAKCVSYSERWDRLYLYSKLKSWETVSRLDPEKPIKGFYGYLETGDRKPTC